MLYIDGLILMVTGFSLILSGYLIFYLFLRPRKVNNDVNIDCELNGDAKSTLHKMRLQNLNNIIIGTLNINSLANKFDYLKHLINSNLDIFILQLSVVEQRIVNDFACPVGSLDIF